jgi:hypothetical protein
MGWSRAHGPEQCLVLTRNDKFTQITVTEMGGKSTSLSIRSHKRQNGSKEESIWLRFSKR